LVNTGCKETVTWCMIIYFYIFGVMVDSHTTCC